jgi:hypothetical protein
MRTLLASLAFATLVAIFAACGDEDLEFGEQNDTPTPDSTSSPGATSTPDNTTTPTVTPTFTPTP